MVYPGEPLYPARKFPLTAAAFPDLRVDERGGAFVAQDLESLRDRPEAHAPVAFRAIGSGVWGEDDMRQTQERVIGRGRFLLENVQSGSSQVAGF